MMDTVVRLFESRDIPQIQAIYSEPGAYENTLQLPYQSAENWEKKLAREGLTSLVAVRGDEMLGHLSLWVLQPPRGRHVATLGMGVKAAARGTGVGSVLLNAAIELCEKWVNVSRIELEVCTDNVAGVALYSKYGFESVRRWFAASWATMPHVFPESSRKQEPTFTQSSCTPQRFE